MEKEPIKWINQADIVRKSFPTISVSNLKDIRFNLFENHSALAPGGIYADDEGNRYVYFPGDSVICVNGNQQYTGQLVQDTGIRTRKESKIEASEAQMCGYRLLAQIKLERLEMLKKLQIEQREYIYKLMLSDSDEKYKLLDKAACVLGHTIFEIEKIENGPSVVINNNGSKQNHD